jgi:hypothetical protein
MMIEIEPEALDGLVRAWLKDTLKTLQTNLAHEYVHPDDEKMYKKDIKAIKWVLGYLGAGL